MQPAPYARSDSHSAAERRLGSLEGIAAEVLDGDMAGGSYPNSSRDHHAREEPQRYEESAGAFWQAARELPLPAKL